MEMIKRKQLLEYVNAMSLVMVDTREYLDTHPEDKDALAHFDKACMLFNQAKKEYTRRFGPLTCDDVDIKEGWTWVTQPMPWERGC